MLPPIRCLVEERIGVGEGFGAACVVSVENLGVESEEDAEAVFLTLQAIGTVPCCHLGKVSVVVLDRRNGLVERDVKVVVEAACPEARVGGLLDRKQEAYGATYGRRRSNSVLTTW